MMASNRKAMLAVAGAGALGAAYYAASRTTRPVRRPSTRDKRDTGAAASGTEQAVVETTAVPGDERPPGGMRSALSAELPLPSLTSSTGGQLGSESKSSPGLPTHNGNPHLKEAEDGGKQMIFTKV